jgi:hypothetical protein
MPCSTRLDQLCLHLHCWDPPGLRAAAVRSLFLLFLLLTPCLGRRLVVHHAGAALHVSRGAAFCLTGQGLDMPPGPFWASFISSRGLCVWFRPGLPSRYRAVCLSRANHRVASVRHPSLVASVAVSSGRHRVPIASPSGLASCATPTCAWDSHCWELLIARLVQPPSLNEAGPTRPTIANYRTEKLHHRRPTSRKRAPHTARPLQPPSQTLLYLCRQSTNPAASQRAASSGRVAPSRHSQVARAS